MILALVFLLLLSSRAEEITDPQPLRTVEDNIILGDYDEFSGSGDEICDDDDGSGSGEVEESEAYSVESASYSMSTSGEVGLDIEITLQKMSDSSVQMLCKMTESTVEGEGSGKSATGRDLASDNFPAYIYLIRDIAVCADLATAVGNDITTDALKLVEVSGPGEDVETLGVTWEEIRQAHCMAVFKQRPEEESSGDEAVVVEGRLAALPLPRCVRKKRDILVAAAPSRVFATLNLATFALVSLGVTGAFTVAAASPAVQNFINNNNNNNNNNHGAEQAVYSFFLAVTPVAMLVGYYYVFTRGASLRRKFDNFSRRVYSINEQMVAERVDYIQEKVSTLVHNVENTLDFPMLRTFGNIYMRNLNQGPFGTLMRLGSQVMNAIRRSDKNVKTYRDPYQEREKYQHSYNTDKLDDDDYYYYDGEYEKMPSQRYYNY